MKIKRRHFSKALKDPLWALDAVYRRISRRNHEQSKSRFPRVALGGNGRTFLQILLQEMEEDGIRFFKGCARDEWAGGVNILTSDVRIMTELIEKASKDTNIEFHINRRNRIFRKSSDFNKTLDSDDALYFSIIITEKTHFDKNTLIRHCSYIDIHTWRPEESYQSKRNYRSSSTAPFVSRLRKETIDLLLDTHADLDSERKEIVYTSRFPIDVVYTWVDDGDPNWLSQKEHYSGKSQKSSRSDHPERFRNRDELKYSLRSLELYAPFVRNIYIVTADQAPDWLDIHHPQIKLISHSQIYRSSKDLPTFNSSSIETQLHHIEGLSEHFLYFNDDFMLGAFCTPDDFFLPNGSIKFFPSEQVAYEPDCQRRSKSRPLGGAKVVHFALQAGNVGRA
ncbi:stealth family protein [Nitratireductor aquimarinus]|uniref:stealth family protein n=1 Tax=Nitratireductor aquimarinus TaxID=889300 RepID=UPI00398F7F02